MPRLHRTLVSNFSVSDDLVCVLFLHGTEGAANDESGHAALSKADGLGSAVDMSVLVVDPSPGGSGPGVPPSGVTAPTDEPNRE